MSKRICYCLLLLVLLRSAILPLFIYCISKPMRYCDILHVLLLPVLLRPALLLLFTY